MKITDPHFETIYNPEILQRLEKLFGPIRQHHVDLTLSAYGMLSMIEKLNRKIRRGEVVMVIPNERGHIWLHTKAFYPLGVYRLMTGGLEPGEKPDLAFQREVEEETGFKTKIDHCLAIITYTITAQISDLRTLIGTNSDFLPFVSYIFVTPPIGDLPQPTDPSEAITNFRAIPIEELTDVAFKLRSLEGGQADWGGFRAIAHEVVRDYFLKR